MATLNTSTHGQSISKSYQSIVNGPAVAASKPATYAQWAVFSVSAPLANAFQSDAGGKESVLKVQNTGGTSIHQKAPVLVTNTALDGDLTDLIDEFSDGRIQFAFVRVKDPNTTLPKFVLIAWCGEGVPERTKGYFTNHLAAVSKVLHVCPSITLDMHLVRAHKPSGLSCTGYCSIRPRPHTGEHCAKSCRCIRLQVHQQLLWCPELWRSTTPHGLQTGLHTHSE